MKKTTRHGWEIVRLPDGSFVWYVSHYEGNGIHKQLGKFIEGMAVNSFGDVLQEAA